MIILAGGQADPNIARMARRLTERRLPYVTMPAEEDGLHRLMWRLGEEHLWIDGSMVRPSAVFLRYDVFTQVPKGPMEARKRASRWYYTVLSWALAHEEVAFLNRRYGSRHATKPHTLHLAKRLGLETPDTVITNDEEVLSCVHDERWIVKPVDGGEYTQVLSELLKASSGAARVAEAPTILQQRLMGPDLRVYGIGDRWFAFTLTTSGIDYRQSSDVVIRSVPVPKDVTEPLSALMDHLGLDFGAADFKMCTRSDRYVFLEINSAPMFAAFDDIVAGALGDAIIDWMLHASASQ